MSANISHQKIGNEYFFRLKLAIIVRYNPVKKYFHVYIINTTWKTWGCFTLGVSGSITPKPITHDRWVKIFLVFNFEFIFEFAHLLSLLNTIGSEHFQFRQFEEPTFSQKNPFILLHWEKRKKSWFRQISAPEVPTSPTCLKNSTAHKKWKKKFFNSDTCWNWNCPLAQHPNLPSECPCP